MSYFSYVGKLFSNVKGFYNEINAATLTGAIDAIIVEQEDGTYHSSPFHVRFGKLGVLRSKEKVVDVEINGEAIDLQMKLGDSGEAFFIEEYDDDEEIPDYLATSPLHRDTDLMEKGLELLKQQSAAVHDDKSDRSEEDVAEHPAHKHADKTEKPESDTCTVNIEPTGENEKSADATSATDTNVGREHLDSVRSNSTIKSDHSRDADIEIKIENESGEVVKVRKKRRRKRKAKNKPETVNTNVASSSTQQPDNAKVEDEDEDIFEMEDLSSDEELSRLTSTMTNGSMSKSISLPIVEESKFARTNEWASAHEGFKYLHSHPFSDTDLSPLGSPVSSRPDTPKSDTEVDRQKSIEQNDRLIHDVEDDTLWEWGAMPVRPSATTEDGRRRRSDNDLISPQGTEDGKAKAGGLFQFMRKTKNVRHKPEEEGIYLDDLNLHDMDEETAKLYFPKRFSNATHFQSIEYKDEDVESGRGASLPQSPHSVEGAIGGPAAGTSNFLISEVRHLGTYSMSLCGGLADPGGVTLERFMSQIVTYDDLCETPAMLANPDLVIKIEDKYYNWATAAPLIMTRIAFQKSLPEKCIKSLEEQHMPKKKEKKGGYSWFSWRRTDGTSPPSTAGGAPAPGGVGPGTGAVTQSGAETGMVNVTKSDGDTSIAATSSENIASASCDSSITESPKKLKAIDRLTVKEDHSSSEGDTEGSEKGIGAHRGSRRRRTYKKSLRLSTEQIILLNLQPGQNEVTYSVTTQYQGTKRCHSHIYLWKYNDKIIVSDIDGTITKSDVLGQILPVMGRDWSQSGVAQLYSRIANNGYKFVYLSARAIGQSKLTKDLLQNIRQGKMTLPEGPLLLSPGSLISAFHKEVIERKPEEFKISCLKDIGNLFPQIYHPFYAGFGNKINDVYSYKAIDIPISRIFTINPKGEIKHELSFTFQTSYTRLSDVADHFFPPLHKVPSPRYSEYSQVQYWREPLPEISPVEVDTVSTTGSSLTLTPTPDIPAAATS